MAARLIEKDRDGPLDRRGPQTTAAGSTVSMRWCRSTPRRGGCRRSPATSQAIHGSTVLSLPHRAFHRGKPVGNVLRVGGRTPTAECAGRASDASSLARGELVPRNGKSARGSNSRRFPVFALVIGTFVRERGVEALFYQPIMTPWQGLMRIDCHFVTLPWGIRGE